MILGGITLGLVLGLLMGGRLANLVSVRLRWAALLFVAVIVRVLTEAALLRGNEAVLALRMPLYVATFGMLLAALWVNRRHPGMVVAFVGVLLNGIAIIVNGGYMPVWAPAIGAAGLGPGDLQSALHVLLPAQLDADFLGRVGPLGDVLPIPLPIIGNVVSGGDLLISAGLAFFLFATVVRSPDEFEADEARLRGRRLVGLAGSARLAWAPDRPRRPISAETGLAPGLSDSSHLERPAGFGLVVPALAPLDLLPDGGGSAAVLPAPRVAIPGAPEISARVRRHPYVRLALNGSFSALWVGQLVSLFGDRVHQIALAFLVLRVTDSPLAVGLVFVAATLPNLLLSPVAGAFVDRWDHKEVMIVSDLLRASVVILIPVVAVVNVYLAYPLVFALTSISIFFRPARVAALPRIVPDDDLMTANSALWIGETLADVVGYPLAGLFVAFVGSALPLAFWIDGASYVVSAALIATMAIPALMGSDGRAADGAAVAGAGAATAGAHAGEAGARDEKTPEATAGAPGAPGERPRIRDELAEGWRFLRGEAVLLANTIQGAIGQFSIGVLATLSPVYARDVLEHGRLDPVAAYAFLETGLGVGGLAGGFVIGLIGARFAKGRLVILGFSAWGLCMAALALTGSLPIAFGLMVGIGVANMVCIIPSQTLFQERTPPELIGRVVGFRSSFVFGSLTIAMVVAGAMGQVVGAAPVIALFGLVTAGAGLAGFLVPAVRDA